VDMMAEIMMMEMRETMMEMMDLDRRGGGG